MNGPPRRLAEGLCEMLNRVVALDAAAHRGLRRLEGHSLGVRLLGPGLQFAVGVEDGRFEPVADADQVAAWIEASPGVLLGLAARGGRAPSGQMSIHGDADAAHRFQAFFAGLQPDWEEGLTRVFGDILGVQIARLLSGFVALARRTGESLAVDMSEYLREETRTLVSRDEVEVFLDAVDDLRDDTERLAARVRRLKERA